MTTWDRYARATSVLGTDMQLNHSRNVSPLVVYFFFECWFTGDDPANEEAPNNT